MTHDHATVESIARQLCDERKGAGHFDAPRTQRNHWRKRARRVLDIQAASPPWITHLMRACGWKL